MGLLALLACSSATPAPGDTTTPATATTSACAEDELDDGGACVPEACGLGPYGGRVGDAYVHPEEPDAFRTIADALAVADHVVVGAGTYRETLVLDRAVTLEGRCAALVTLDARADAQTFGLQVDTSRPATLVTLSGLTVADADSVGVYLGRGTLVAADVRVVRAAGVGLFVDGGDATLTDVVVQDTRTLGGDFGWGLGVQGGGTVEASRLTLTGNRDASLFAGEAGSTVSVTDLVITDTQPEADGSAAAVQAQQGALVSVEGGRFERSGGAAVDAVGATIELRDVLVRDVEEATAGSGSGLAAVQGGTIDASSTVVEHAQGYGVYALSGDVVLDEVDIVEPWYTERRQGAGRGIMALDGGVVTVRGGSVEGAFEVGVGAATPGTRVTLDGARIVGTRASPLYGTSVALYAVDHAEVDADAVEILDSVGVGLAVQSDATLHCAACVVRRSGFAGAIVLGGVLRLEGGSIDAVTGDPGLGGGVGVFTSDRYGPSTLEVDGTGIEAARYAGVWIVGEGSHRIEGATIVGGPGEEVGGARLGGQAIIAVEGGGAWDGAQGLLVTGTTLSGSDGPAVLLDGATATLNGNAWVDNGVDVVQQGCPADPPEVDADASLILCPAYDLLLPPLDYEIQLVDADVE